MRKTGRLATLKDVLADEKLLRSMDLDPQRLYPVTAEDLQHLVALVEASPMYISHRMQLVESEIPGKETLVLAAHPSLLAERVKAHPSITSVQAWRLPYERMMALMKIDRETQVKAATEFAPFQVAKAVLWQARVLQLLGTFEGEKGANALYQSARPPESDLKLYRDRAPEKSRPQVDQDVALMQAAKQAASYWLGLIAYERGNYPAAVDYIQTRTLEAAAGGPLDGRGALQSGPLARSTRPHGRGYPLLQGRPVRTAARKPAAGPAAGIGQESGRKSRQG